MPLPICILHPTVACQPSVHPHGVLKPKEFTAAAIGERHVRAEALCDEMLIPHRVAAYSQGFLTDFFSPALLFLFLL